MDWEKILIGIGGAAVAAAVNAAARYWQARQRAGKRTAVHNGYRAISAAHAQLNIIQNCMPGIRRVLVLSSQNGGGIPGPTNPVTSSALWEASAIGMSSMLGLWENRPVDGFYSELLLQLIEKSHVRIRTAKEEDDKGPNIVPWGCPLFNVYKADGIAFSDVHLLGVLDGKKTFYVSVNFGTEAPDDLDFGVRATIEAALEALKNIYHADSDAFFRSSEPR